MMNPQVRVIPPAILKIATLINFFSSFYIICLYALFLSYIYVYIYNMFSFLCMYYIYMRSNNKSCVRSSIRA